MYRALIAAETVAQQLGTGEDLWSVGRQYFEGSQEQEQLRALEPDRMKRTIFSFLDLARESPDLLHHTLSDLSDGRVRINVNVSEAPKMARARNRRARLLACSILSVSLAVLLTMPHPSQLFGVPIASMLWIALIINYIYIIIIMNTQ